MDYYINITVKPNSEMRKNLLLNNVYTKLHLALCSLKSTQIGVSFPQFSVMLGSVLRIHATKERLEELQSISWLGGLEAYCHLSKIDHIPANVCHRIISRKQANMSKAKLNRLLKRGTIKQEQVKAYMAKMFQKGVSNPYLELESLSTGHKYRRYISFGEIADKPTVGLFDQFGLSKEGSIPWFQT